MSVTSMDVNGNTVTIDNQVFLGYSKEAYQIQQKIADLNQEFKDVVETVSDTIKLDKKYVSKYFKLRFKATTKVPKAEGIIYEALDDILVS